MRAAQVARLLGVNPKTVSRWADVGWIPCTYTEGGHRRFNFVEIVALLEEQGANPRSERMCTRCGNERPATMFATTSSVCSECRTKPTKIVDVVRLTNREYKRMLKAQKGRCAVCRKKETETRSGIIKRFAADHKHGTKVVRGLLCGRCNRLLGMAEDNPKILRRALRYLAQSE